MAATQFGSSVGSAPGVEIWRLESFKLVKQPASAAGNFYSGDSYLVLHTFSDGSSRQHHIHFWLGEDTSQDEAGSAAIFATELDDALGGRAKQFREVQGAESPEFLQVFGGTVRYLQGGVASGFNHVQKQQAKTCLLQVKGRKAVRVSEVPVQVASLNSGDVFILDTGEQLYQWAGSGAARAEKARALDVVAALRADRGGRIEVTVLEEGDTTSAGARAFFAALGTQDPSKVTISTAAAGGDDEAGAAGALTAPKLFVVSDGKQPTEVAERPLPQSALDSSAAALLAAAGVLYVWLGSGASAEERKGSMALAQRFIADQKLPSNTPVQLVKEGAEPPAFKQNFPAWARQEALASRKAGKAEPSSRAVEGGNVDVGALLSGKTGHPDDDGILDVKESHVQVWRIENMEMVEWPRDKAGQFYSGDSFIVLWSYKDPAGRPGYTIYMWQGRDSSQDEKGACAILAAKLDEKRCNGKAVQVRVPQNKEPRQFVKLFGGSMVVHSGGKASGWRNVTDADSYDTDGTYLYHIRGDGDAVLAVQVEEKASSLASSDCFFLIAKNTAYIWQGSGSNEAERKTAQAVADRLAAQAGNRKVVAEGSEDDAFWAALGGKADYAKTSSAGAAAPPPRLFLVSDGLPGGVEEVHRFAQDDLMPDDVFFLDAYYAVFLWVGAGAHERERAAGQAVAQRYIQATAAVDGRDPQMAVAPVTPGEEPALFTACFPGWDHTAAKTFVDPYEAKLAKLKAEQQAQAASGTASAPAADAQPAATPAAKTPAKPPAKAAGAAAANGNTAPSAEANGSAAAVNPGGQGSGKKASPASKAAPQAVAAEDAAAGSGRQSEPGALTPNASSTVRTSRSGDFNFNRRSSEGGRLNAWGYGEKREAASLSQVRLTSTGAYGSSTVTPRALSLTEHTVTAPPPPFDNLKYQPGSHEVPLEELKGMTLDSGIDPTRKEEYLSEQAFQELFKKTRAEFKALPVWRQRNMKKDVGLF